MPTTTNPSSLRAYVSLSQLAEDLLSLSRARVYELIERGALPQPIYDLRTRRPIFNEDLQRQALAVRATGVGIDGSAVIFYRRDRNVAEATGTITPTRARRRASIPQFTDLVTSLQGLGIAQADERSVAAAVAECFPQGIDAQQESDVLRTIFRDFRRRETA